MYDTVGLQVLTTLVTVTPPPPTISNTAKICKKQSVLIVDEWKYGNMKSRYRFALTQRQYSVVSVSMDLLQSIGTETTLSHVTHAQKCIRTLQKCL